MSAANQQHTSPGQAQMIAMTPWILPAVVFCCALILRLIVLFQFREINPLFDHPVVDAWRYDTLARDFLRLGYWPEQGAFFQPPAYPFFLAAIYTFLGESYTWVRVIQACLGSLSCLFICLLGARLYTKQVGFAAGIVMALYGPLIFFDLDLLAPVLIVFFSTLGLLLFHTGMENNHRGLLLAAGISLGAALVSWPIIGLFCAGLFVAVAWRLRRQPGKILFRLVPFCIGVILPILPVFLHNLMHGEWVLVSTNGGINFYVGNNPDWQETVAMRPGYPWEKIVTMPYHLYGAEQVEKIGSSSLFFREAAKFITSHPFDYARNQLLKLYQLVFGYEIMRNTDLYFFKQYSPTLDRLIGSWPWFKFPFGLMFPLAALGIWTSLRREAGKNVYLLIYLAAGSLGLLLFFVTARYRVILVPVLALYAVLGARYIVNIFRNAERFHLLPAALLLVFFVLANVNLVDPRHTFNSPVYRAQAPFTLGRVNLENGDPRQALAWLRQSVDIDPGYPDAWVDIGRAEYDLGERKQAIKAMQKAISVAPDYPLPYFNLALIYDRPDFTEDEARKYYRLFIDKSLAYFEDYIRGTGRLEQARQRLTQLNADAVGEKKP